MWKFNLDNEAYNIKLKENEGDKKIQIIINTHKYTVENTPNHLIEYKDHKFNFIKSEKQNYQLNIDSYSFDELKQNNDKPNEKPPNNNITDLTFNESQTKVNDINVFDAYEKIVLNKKKDVKKDLGDNNINVDDVNDRDNKRTGSDIYKSVESESNIKKSNDINSNKNTFVENSINIKNDENWSNAINKKNNLSTNVNKNIVIEKYRKKVLDKFKGSEYVDEINFDDIPEYDYINEKIINASIINIK